MISFEVGGDDGVSVVGTVRTSGTEPKVSTAFSSRTLHEWLVLNPTIYVVYRSNSISKLEVRIDLQFSRNFSKCERQSETNGFDGERMSWRRPR
jgi:hypothetical protein